MPDVLRADIAIVGGGPAGMAAAIAADSHRKLVAIIDDQPATGGQIWRRDFAGSPSKRAANWFRRVEATSAWPVNGGTVIDTSRGDRGHLLTIERDGKAEQLFASCIILATGARELFLPFPGWTLPGIVGVGAAQALAKTGFDVRGKRVVIAGSGPLLVAVAASLARRGAHIVLVAEQAPVGRVMRFATRMIAAPQIAADAVRYASAISPRAFRFGTWIVAARGDGAVREAVITDGSTERTVECDLLCVGYGLVPNTQLAHLLGCSVSSAGLDVDDDQQTTIPGIYAAGECVGIAGVDAALAEGEIAGHAAAGAPVANPSLRRARRRARDWGRRLESTFALRPEVLATPAAGTIICRCEDVPMGAVDRAWTARQAKLYTRMGMGACQGRVCGAAATCLFGWEPDRVRAPIYPSRVSSLARDSIPGVSGEPPRDSTTRGEDGD